MSFFREIPREHEENPGLPTEPEIEVQVVLWTLTETYPSTFPRLVGF